MGQLRNFIGTEECRLIGKVDGNSKMLKINRKKNNFHV